ncbi:hypothetical protein BHE90_001093 [Fusarium euwallaceae]|uniref:Azaphilone pigments biosynthesis cluster protein L N-terminal domain-containing protein n=1 Tax=Fusarium euwallaceae TaxID=1147111 RepID=A0A430M8R4_9HYPO|nr:hypothetical protein BHE90_001093 [Fusarium euwallaceae]
MDPLSAGASVVTFLGLAFSVTKTVHNTLSTIKDGPKVIQHLNEEFSQLKSILERLSHISMSATDAAELDSLAKKCNDDVACFEKKLRRLDTSGADGRRGKLWRQLKLCFTEKDLGHMRNVVHGHTQLLTIRLNIIQVQQGSFSATQSAEVLNLLQKLRDDVTALRQVNSSVPVVDEGPRSPRVVELDNEQMGTCAGLALDESIERLMRLVERKPCIVDSENAEELVGDLEHLLRSVRRDAAAIRPLETTPDHSNGENVSKELKLITSLILSAPSINVNQTVPLGLVKAMSRGTIIHQERKRKMFDIGEGVVTLTSTKRQCRHPEQPENLMSRQTSEGREFAAKLVFKPRNTSTMLTVSVSQAQVRYDTFTSILPQITVNNILPPDSLVFSVAANGTVQELLALVAEGRASLHDHDTYGQSLLHRSEFNLPVCKFLIEQGLDVNERSIWHRTPLNGAERNPELFHALLDAGADPTIELDVGFPSLFQEASRRRDPRAGLILREMFRTSPFVRYGDQADLGTNPVLDCFRNLFNSHYATWGQAYLQRLGFLLDQGYSLHLKWADGTNCLTQFFLASQTQTYLESRRHVQGRREILLFLVSRGADAYSTDSKGRSVSDYAYNQVFCTACNETYPPYLGDLWDSVLDECGYDISEFRKIHPRKPRYNDIYTRQIFEQLWQGREHRCPYWNDAKWPDSSLDGVTKTWSILDENGKMCDRCEICFHGEFAKGVSNCGKCGYCASRFDCWCGGGSWGGSHWSFCYRPLHRAIRWDEEEGRYFFFDDDDGRSSRDGLDDDISSLDIQDGREQHESATCSQEGDHWNNLSPGSPKPSESAMEGSQSEDELFENPWERD